VSFVHKVFQRDSKKEISFKKNPYVIVVLQASDRYGVYAHILRQARKSKELIVLIYRDIQSQDLQPETCCRLEYGTDPDLSDLVIESRVFSIYDDFNKYQWEKLSLHINSWKNRNFSMSLQDMERGKVMLSGVHPEFSS